MPGRPPLHESPDPGPHLRLSVKQLPWFPRRRDKSRERPAAAHRAEAGAGDLQYYNSFLLLKEEEGSVECGYKAVIPVENIWDVVIDIAWLRISPITITTANIHPTLRPAHRPLPRKLRGRADGRAQPGEGVLHR